MKFVSKWVGAALAVTLLAGTGAAQTEPADNEVAKLRSELAATQKALTETKQALEKSQTDQVETQARLAETIKNSQVELAAVQKILSETKQTLTESQAEVGQAAKAREILGKQVVTEKAQAIAAAAKLDHAIKESVRAKEELIAARTLTDAQETKTQRELATYQKTLAEARTAADELRKSLEAEIKDFAARLEAAKSEAALIRTELQTAAVQMLLSTKEEARTKAELRAAQKTLARQPALPVTVVVTLPADAQLAFDDHITTSIGGSRLFISPPLSVGPTFYYTLKAEVMREGRVVTMQKQIEVHAGDVIEVSLMTPTPGSTGQP